MKTVDNTATYQLSEQINQEADDANTVIFRTRIHAAKMTKHLASPGQLKRWLHDEDVLVSLKKQLQDYDSKSKKWKSA